MLQAMMSSEVPAAVVVLTNVGAAGTVCGGGDACDGGGCSG